MERPRWRLSFLAPAQGERLMSQPAREEADRLVTEQELRHGSLSGKPRFVSAIARPGHYASYYGPLKWLLEQGYAEKKDGRYSDIYRLTASGRDALAKAKGATP